ncbi:phosphoribosylformylglycinamidine synthase, partial [mine drainage metagenome]
PGEDARLFDAVAAASALARALDISIPVGKDSLSMQTSWDDAESGAQRTVAPVSLVVSAFARVTDVRRALTPQLRLDQGISDLWLLDLGAGRDRLGESILVQVFNRGGGLAPDVDDPASLRALFAFVQQANAQGLLLAYHDRSDGGLIVTLLEMAFAGHCGLTLQLDGWGEATLRVLFNEELGAVLQVRRADRARLQALAVSHGLDKILHPSASRARS